MERDGLREAGAGVRRRFRATSWLWCPVPRRGRRCCLGACSGAAQRWARSGWARMTRSHRKSKARTTALGCRARPWLRGHTAAPALCIGVLAFCGAAPPPLQLERHQHRLARGSQVAPCPRAPPHAPQAPRLRQTRLPRAARERPAAPVCWRHGAPCPQPRARRAPQDQPLLPGAAFLLAETQHS